MVQNRVHVPPLLGPTAHLHHHCRQEQSSTGEKEDQTDASGSFQSVPSFVGPYRILRALGKGCFGRVLLGEHILTGEKVAVKFIQKFSRLETRVRRIINREICLLKLLDHPSIVKMIDVVQESPSHGDFIAMVMESIEGGELFDYINTHGPLPEATARGWFRQLVSAIDYCQRNFLVHRDVKPENILIDSSGSIKLIDFGFANFFSKNSILSTFCGSPFYAAPEVIQGIPYTGPEVDVWSLGITLYTMLCGKLPFEAESMNDLLELQRKSKYSRLGLSSETDRLIRRMLECDPKRRALLSEVKENDWLSRGYPLPFPSVDLRHRKYPISSSSVDGAAVSYLVSLGYEDQHVVNVLLNEREHPLTALYYLYLESESKKASSNHSLKFGSIEMNELISPVATSCPPQPHGPKHYSLSENELNPRSFFGNLNCFRPFGPSAASSARPVRIRWGLCTYSGTFHCEVRVLSDRIERLLKTLEAVSFDRASPNEFVCSVGRESFEILLTHGRTNSKIGFTKNSGSFWWLRRFSLQFLRLLNDPCRASNAKLPFFGVRAGRCMYK